jgi:hypothetical protein
VNGNKHNQIQASPDVRENNNQNIHNGGNVLRYDLPDSVNRYCPPLNREDGYEHRHGFGCLDVGVTRLRLRTDDTFDFPSISSNMKPREQVQSCVHYQYDEKRYYCQKKRGKTRDHHTAERIP